VFQDVPIYERLVVERGDVVTQSRQAADRVRRDLEAVIGPLQPDTQPGDAAGPAW